MLAVGFFFFSRGGAEAIKELLCLTSIRDNPQQTLSFSMLPEMQIARLFYFRLTRFSSTKPIQTDIEFNGEGSNPVISDFINSTLIQRRHF